MNIITLGTHERPATGREMQEFTKRLLDAYGGGGDTIAWNKPIEVNTLDTGEAEEIYKLKKELAEARECAERYWDFIERQGI